MPYQDIKVLDVEDMEVKGNFNIIVLHGNIVKNPKSSKLVLDATLKSSFVRAKGSSPKKVSAKKCR